MNAPVTNAGRSDHCTARMTVIWTSTMNAPVTNAGRGDHCTARMTVIWTSTMNAPVTNAGRGDHSTAAAIRAPRVCVVALPPMSGVSASGSASTVSMARSMAPAASA